MCPLQAGCSFVCTECIHLVRTIALKPVAGSPVTSEERKKAKTVTYGIVYGLSAWGLAKGSAGLGIDTGQAQNLISSFLDHFQGVISLCPELPALTGSAAFMS